MPIRIVPSADNPAAEPRHIVEAREKMVGGSPPPDHDGLEALNDDAAEVMAAFAAERGITRPPRRAGR